MELEIKTSYLPRVTLLVKQCLLSLPDRKICALAFRARRGEKCRSESLPPEAKQLTRGWDSGSRLFIRSSSQVLFQLLMWGGRGWDLAQASLGQV